LQNEIIAVGDKRLEKGSFCWKA